MSDIIEQSNDFIKSAFLTSRYATLKDTWKLRDNCRRHRQTALLPSLAVGRAHLPRHEEVKEADQVWVEDVGLVLPRVVLALVAVPAHQELLDRRTAHPPLPPAQHRLDVLCAGQQSEARVIGEPLLLAQLRTREDEDALACQMRKVGP